MQIQADTPENYISQIPEDRQQSFRKLRRIILDNLPAGFSETMNYGMIGYVVPHTIYPAGYHVDPKLPLPFISIASQKHFIAFYHMGLYVNKDLLDWLKTEYMKYSKSAPDIGKSCIRFRKIEQIPFSLIGELCSKVTTGEWIKMYESIRR